MGALRNQDLHSIFMLQEFSDAGALPTTSERGAKANAFWHMMNCLKCFQIGYAKIK
jgi:hypothetical protein